MIDLGDLTTQELMLGRRVLEVLSPDDRRAFGGQRVMITGAGGAVGSEIARQIARGRPARLTVFDQSESSLSELDRELREAHPDLDVEPILGDIRRRRSVRAACRLARPQVVYHVAAYRHAAVLERAVCAAVETNVLGAVTVARAAADMGARMVVASSDDSEQPQSVLAATRRLAEMAVVSLAAPVFRPVVVRFGHILGSRGSWAERLVDLARRGLPLRIPSPDATRLFMTAQEAAWLALKADLVGRSAEIHWLDTGAPIRVLTIAQRLLALLEREGYPPVSIEVVGLGPGECLHEEPAARGLEGPATAHGRVRAVRHPPFDTGRVRRVLRALRQDVIYNDAMGALSDLSAAVPEYRASQEAWTGAAAASVKTATALRPASSVSSSRDVRP